MDASTAASSCKCSGQMQSEKIELESGERKECRSHAVEAKWMAVMLVMTMLCLLTIRNESSNRDDDDASGTGSDFSSPTGT